MPASFRRRGATFGFCRRQFFVASVLLLSFSVLCLARPQLTVAQQPAPANSPAAQPQQQPTSDVQVKVFSMQRGDATARVQILQALFGQGQGGIRPLRLAADPRSNSIIAAGSGQDLEIIRALLARLDAAASDQRSQPPAAAPPPRPSPSLAPAGGGQEGQAAQAPGREPNIVVGDVTLVVDRPTQIKLLELELKDAELRVAAAKAELDRHNEISQKNPRATNAPEMARAQLAVRLADIQVEKLKMLVDGLKNQAEGRPILDGPINKFDPQRQPPR